MSAALTHLYAARSRPNLEVRGDTRVTRIVFDGPRATGVEIVDGDGRTVIEAGEVILTAGAIESPHLLLASGVGPAAQLQQHGIEVVADRRGVGENLRDHPMLVVPLSAPDNPDEAALNLVCVAYTAEGSPVQNDMNILMGAARLPDGQGGEISPLMLIAMLEKADSAGKLELVSGDPLEPPRLDYRYLESDLDRSRLRESVRICARLLEHPGFADIDIARAAPTDEVLASDEQLDAWVDENVVTLFHTCGTCRMGDVDDPDAVVDDHGRVIGVEGLRVADLSIAPDAPRAACNATAFMIAERMADLVKGVTVPA
jgi:choline dehydrogenase-like flavoprotein